MGNTVGNCPLNFDFQANYNNRDNTRTTKIFKNKFLKYQLGWERRRQNPPIALNLEDKIGFNCFQVGLQNIVQAESRLVTTTLHIEVRNKFRYE